MATKTLINTDAFRIKANKKIKLKSLSTNVKKKPVRKVKAQAMLQKGVLELANMQDKL